MGESSENDLPDPEEILNVNVGVLGHVDSGKTKAAYISGRDLHLVNPLMNIVLCLRQDVTCQSPIDASFHSCPRQEQAIKRTRDDT